MAALAPTETTTEPSPTPTPQPLGAAVFASADPASATSPVALNPQRIGALDLVNTTDFTAPDEACQVGQTDERVVTCGAGDLSSTRIIALVGDSKIGQWLPALDVLGKTHGWRVRIYVKSSCPFANAVVRWRTGPYPECPAWGAKVLDRLLGDERPDVVLTSAVRGGAYSADGIERRGALVTGYVDYWQRLTKAGVRVVAVADTPQPPPERDIRECLLGATGDFQDACSYAYEPGYGTPALAAAVGAVPGAAMVDLDDFICPADTCWPVLGDTIVYRNGSHLTRAYAASLAPAFWEALTHALPDVVHP